MELIQFSAGRGPIECSWAVWEIYTRFCADAVKQGLEPATVEMEPDRSGNTYKSIIVSLTGESAAAFCREWTGTVQFTAQSPFRPEHRRKNWFIAVNRIPLIDKEVFSAQDIRFETMRSSGAGGQHVNKTESCVRATHIPTNTVVVIGAHRSQHQNKALAVAILMNRLKDAERRKSQLLEKQTWQNHNELIRGNPVKKFTF
jgi:peptide chain release factor